MNNKKKEVTAINQEETATAKVETVESTNPQPEAKTVNLLSPEQLQQMLQQQLAEIQRKKMLADHRAIFIQRKEQLEQKYKEITEADRQGEFESKTAIITLTVSQGYQNSEAIRVTNTALVAKFIENLLESIDFKVNEIEKELLTA